MRVTNQTTFNKKYASTYYDTGQKTMGGSDIYRKDYHCLGRTRLFFKALSETIFSAGFAVMFSENVREDWVGFAKGRKLLALQKGPGYESSSSSFDDFDDAASNEDTLSALFSDAHLSNMSDTEEEEETPESFELAPQAIPDNVPAQETPEQAPQAAPGEVSDSPAALPQDGSAVDEPEQPLQDAEDVPLLDSQEIEALAQKEEKKAPEKVTVHFLDGEEQYDKDVVLRFNLFAAVDKRWAVGQNEGPSAFVCDFPKDWFNLVVALVINRTPLLEAIDEETLLGNLSIIEDLEQNLGYLAPLDEDSKGQPLDIEQGNTEIVQGFLDELRNMPLPLARKILDQYASSEKLSSFVNYIRGLAADHREEILTELKDEPLSEIDAKFILDILTEEEEGLLWKYLEEDEDTGSENSERDVAIARIGKNEEEILAKIDVILSKDPTAEELLDHLAGPNGILWSFIEGYSTVSLPPEPLIALEDSSGSSEVELEDEAKPAADAINSDSQTPEAILEDQPKPAEVAAGSSEAVEEEEPKTSEVVAAPGVVNPQPEADAPKSAQAPALVKIAQERIDAYSAQIMQAQENSGADMRRKDLLECLIGPEYFLLDYYGFTVQGQHPRYPYAHHQAKAHFVYHFKNYSPWDLESEIRADLRSGGVEKLPKRLIKDSTPSVKMNRMVEEKFEDLIDTLANWDELVANKDQRVKEFKQFLIQRGKLDFLTRRASNNRITISPKNIKLDVKFDKENKYTDVYGRVHIEIPSGILKLKFKFNTFDFIPYFYSNGKGRNLSRPTKSQSADLYHRTIVGRSFYAVRKEKAAHGKKARRKSRTQGL